MSELILDNTYTARFDDGDERRTFEHGTVAMRVRRPAMRGSTRVREWWSIDRLLKEDRGLVAVYRFSGYDYDTSSAKLII